MLLSYSKLYLYLRLKERDIYLKLKIPKQVYEKEIHLVDIIEVDLSKLGNKIND